MNILYIGFAVNRKMESDYVGISVAGNKMQVNFLRQLYKRFGKECLKIITIFPIAAYPRDKELIIKKGTVSIDDEYGLNGTVPFMVNLPIVKNICEFFFTAKEANKIVKDNNVKKVIIFNAFPQTTYAATRLKKRYGCEITCLLADLPLDDSINTKGIRFILRNAFDRYTKKAIKKMDKLVVLNEQAAKDYAPNVPYLVMEGAVALDDVVPFSYVIAKEKNIVFTGALQKHNGIIELIEAANALTDQDIYFDIYGDGDFKTYVIENTTTNKHIRYHGRVANSIVQEKQREAFLLINPRPVDNYISKVTFPSKIFEYMMSGTPVLTTRLNGFTEEYFDTMYFIEDNKAVTIEGAIRKILLEKETVLKSRAMKAYDLVTKKKNWDIQSQRIFEFIGGE